jgi:uncharacterized RDD family membrane protein YckC
MNKTPAKFKIRAYAFAVDLTAIGALQLTLGSLTLLLYQSLSTQFGTDPDYDIQLFLSQFCGGFFFITYFTFSVGVFGNTLGKYLFKIETVYERDGLFQKPTLKQAYWRSMGYLMSSWTYMIGFIIPWFRTDNLALHDLLCGSRVVEQVQSAASSVQPISLPHLATVHPIQTPTTEQVLISRRTGTDR